MGSNVFSKEGSVYLRMSTTAAIEKEKAKDALDLYNSMGCVERVTNVTTISLVAGGLLGAVQASWNEASHVGVVRSTKWAMLQSTALGVAKSSVMFGVAGGAYAVGECASQTCRGDAKNTWENQAFGGACAGFAMGAM